MATTLTDPIATVTLAGTAERISLPSKYSWVWVRNDTEAAVYISQAEDVGEGVSGSVAIPAGGAARLALTGDSFYAVGTGAVQVVAANYTDCPFKAAPASGGGGSESEKSVMTLIGKFNITSSSWTNIGILEAGTRLLIESAAVIGQTTTSSNAGSIVGYAIVPNADAGSLYAKIMMLYPTSSTASSMMMNFQPSQSSTNGPVSLAGSTYIQGAFNVYKLEVPTA